MPLQRRPLQRRRRDREEHPGGILKQCGVVEVGALDHLGDLEVAREPAVNGNGSALDQANSEGLATVEGNRKFGLAGQGVECLLLGLTLARGLLLLLLDGPLLRALT